VWSGFRTPRLVLGRDTFLSMTRQRAKKKTIHDSAVPSRPGGLVASSWIVLSS
jgi:hypothetical protein